MKLIFTILFLWAYSSSATIYYVSNSGNDANDGLTLSSTWQTISKINATAFSPDDFIMFQGGGVWNEALKVSSSGTSAHPITIGAYGIGVKPIITGLQSVTVTNVGGNIWQATVPNAPATLNNVLINGTQRAKARYPNTGYFTPSGSTTMQLNNTGLTGTPDFTGAEVVVRLAHWVLNKRTISSQSGATLNLSSALEGTPLDGYGAFIQNSLLAADQDGEWYNNPVTKVFSVYSSSQPSVQLSNIDTLVWISKKNYVTIDGLSFIGANTAAVQIDTASYVTIKNSSFNYSGNNAITSFKSPYLTLDHDSIQNSLNNGMYLVGGTHATVTDPYVKNTGVLAGMGQSGEGKYCAIYIGGGDIGANDTASVIRYARIDTTGYQPIMFFSYGGTIEYCYITYFAFIKDDGGGVYAGWNGGVRVRYCIISNGIGAPSGATGNVIAPGIYFDAGQINMIAEYNTVYDCIWGGMFLNSNDHNTARFNTFIATNGIPLWSGTSSSNFTSANNILYSKSSSYAAFSQPSTTVTNKIDSNYYVRPSSETNKLTIGSTPYGLSAWRSLTGWDLHSKETPSGITSDEPLFLINPSKTDSTISLGSYSYYDARGVGYRETITLKPYTSALLFKSAKDFLIITGQSSPILYKSLQSL